MILYEIIGPNNFKYVGVTKNFKQRINLHKNAWKNKRFCNYPLYKDIKKHGWNSFKVREICFGNENDCCFLESEIIKQNKEKGLSYNIADYKSHTKKSKEFYQRMGKLSAIKNKESLRFRFSHMTDKDRKKYCKLATKAIRSKMKFFKVYKNDIYMGTFKCKRKAAEKLNVKANYIYRLLNKTRFSNIYKAEYKGANND